MFQNTDTLEKAILTGLLLLGAGVMLVSCESPNPTKANILPEGYVWHDATPLKSPPKTQPWMVEEDIGTVARDLSKEQWLHAADDLVTSLMEQQEGLPSKVLLRPAGGHGSSAVMRSYDSYLRELLITRDITITTDRNAAGGVLVYDVKAPGDSGSLTGSTIVNTRTETMHDFLTKLKGKPVLKLTLALETGGKRQAAARGLYHVHGQKMKRYEWALMPVPRYETATSTGTFNE